MFQNIENLKILTSSQGVSKEYSNVKSRKTNVFIFRTSGTAIYKFSDKTLTANKGEVIFVPQGSTYEFKVVSEEECRYTTINFSADLTNPKPMVYSLENFTDADYICSHFTNLWKFGNKSEKYKCYSLFYNLLSYISNIENLDYSDKRKFEIIEPALTYLKSHIFDSSLKADKLHLLCGISDTYFRKIFIAKFGTSPQKYITGKRISQAKSVIDSGDFDTIGEIALSVGYSDPLYFSRVFKKKYGISPLNMNKEA